MPEEVYTVVKIPITEIEESVRAKHLLPKILKDIRIDGDALVLYFGDESHSIEEDFVSHNPVQRRRRANRRRNRMKTRGWEIVAHITNSKGQKCSIYKPFIEVLSDPRLTFEQQRTSVERILRSNRNKPSETSVQYFLENTLEYLKMSQSGNGSNDSTSQQ